jgi:hypothetical protein
MMIVNDGPRVSIGNCGGKEQDPHFSKFSRWNEFVHVPCERRSAPDVQNPRMIINDALMIAAPCGERQRVYPRAALQTGELFQELFIR